MSKSTFTIYEQVSPVPSAHNKFRIIETIQTVDGPRSGLSEKVFATLSSADNWIGLQQTAVEP